MPSLEVTNFLTSMKRKGEVLSIKGLNAQINVMMQVICLIEEEDSRIQFMKRIEVVQEDLLRLRSKLESKMPRNVKRPSTLNIDHSRLLIGSEDEGYMSLTGKIWQKVQDITRKIDSLSEGLVFIVQRHHDSRQRQVSRSNRFDSHSHADRNVQDKFQQMTQDFNHGSNYPSLYSQSDGSQVQISSNHARRHHHPLQQTSQGFDHDNYSSQYSQSDGSQFHIPPNHAKPHLHPPSISQPFQHNQFTPTPNYRNTLQPPNMNRDHHRDRCSTNSSSSQLEASRKHSHEYLTQYPSAGLSYFPGGHHSKQSGPSYQNLNMPYPPSSPFWGIPAKLPNIPEFSDCSYTEGSISHGHPRNPQKTGAKYIHRSRELI